MTKLIFQVALILIALLSLAACAELVPAPPAPAVPQPLTTAPPLLTDRNQYFAASGVCATCHTDLTDRQGHDISFDTAWRATMMANSARDPYWRAGLRREVLSHPAEADFIQDKCATCHMPMARTTINISTDGEDYAVVFGETGLAQPDNPNHNLAMDSISCTLCHQITEAHLGTPEGDSGHYTIDQTAGADNRTAYGPFQPESSQVAYMQTSSGFVQTHSAHVQTAELCASCHDLYTESFDATTGELRPVEFPEQMPYSEWEHSGYRETKTCQTCHMPVAANPAPVAGLGDPTPLPRTEVSQHPFVGGNVYLPRTLQQFGAELDVTASAAQFQNTINLTRRQLHNDTAKLGLENVRLADGTLSLDAVIQSKVGHKLPSAYPSRRAWLHLTVRNRNQQIIFESGAYNQDGSIVGNDNDADALQYEPHYAVISQPDQVQIYEAVMGDTTGKPTTILLLASTYLKDNRLLPEGFDKTTAPPQVAVHGEAEADTNFSGGSDRITYQIAVDQAGGPFTIEAELLYQTLGFRWADNLREYEDPETAPEIVKFIDYYEAVPNVPEWIAKSRATAK
jgi:hypothetical protein